MSATRLSRRSARSVLLSTCSSAYSWGFPAAPASSFHSITVQSGMIRCAIPSTPPSRHDAHFGCALYSHRHRYDPFVLNFMKTPAEVSAGVLRIPSPSTSRASSALCSTTWARAFCVPWVIPSARSIPRRLRRAQHHSRSRLRAVARHGC